jgi:formylglycine-generating enzyme required for sulfatase activity
MVYVPQGSFYVGSGHAGTGGSENGVFYTYPTITNAYLITSENAITVGTTAGNLFYPTSPGYSGDQIGPIPAAFPKGYKAFYCMKYEITQAQYVEFLNKLTNAQASTRAYTANQYRYNISGSPGSYTTAYPYVACSYLGWSDISAYLDWAALRPMTELEYEKACRGPLAPVDGEFAWGNFTITQATGISNSGANNEIATPAAANCVYGSATNVQGPMRVGNFARATSTRESAGASYYGIMDLSGNLWEGGIITVGTPGGRAFTGIHGDGVLDASGNANVSNWNSSGFGSRGGSWSDISDYDRVSDRYYATYAAGRSSIYGGRGVRTAP